MPEGDTVYLAAKRMTAALRGKRLTRGELRHPRLAEHDLSGLAVLGVQSVGKHMFTRFDDGRSLHTHFRMDGSWHLYRPGQRWRRPGHQARAVLTTQERVAVGFLLYDMALVVTQDEHRLVGHLGGTWALICSSPAGTTTTPRSRLNDYAGTRRRTRSCSARSTDHGGMWESCIKPGVRAGLLVLLAGGDLAR